MINDDFIINLVFDSLGRVKPTWRKLVNDDNILDYIQNRFSDGQNYTIKELLYRIYNHIEHETICLYCHKHFIDYKHEYRDCCSFTCMRKYYNIKLVYNYTQSSEERAQMYKHRSENMKIKKEENPEWYKQIFEKRKNTYKQKELEHPGYKAEIYKKVTENARKNHPEDPFGIKKRKKTCTELYGEDYLSIFAKKANQTIKERHGSSSWALEKTVNSIKKTKLERYGDENYNNREQAAKTCIEKYNATTWAGSTEGKTKLSQILSNPIIVEKINNTKKENNSFNSSNPEELIYNFLLILFKDVKRQYFDDRYPYKCDFYIPELDLFIECNFHWTHNGHWFNENSEEDQNILNQWKEKAKTSQFYKNAINVWTIRDINKKLAAIKSQINYLVLWNLNDSIDTILNYLDQYKVS